MLAAERQMKRARAAYFAAVLRQDSAWFDTVKSGEMASNLAENSLTWKSGIAEKFPQAFTGVAQMCTGLTLGFYYSWQLTLLIMSIAPGLALMGGAIKFASGKLEKKASDAMSEAGAFATEAPTAFESLQHTAVRNGRRVSTTCWSRKCRGHMTESLCGWLPPSLQCF